jgi:hypothetical protein
MASCAEDQVLRELIGDELYKDYFESAELSSSATRGGWTRVIKRRQKSRALTCNVLKHMAGIKRAGRQSTGCHGEELSKP